VYVGAAVKEFKITTVHIDVTVAVKYRSRRETTKFVVVPKYFGK
jgi:hypothetical protein